MSQLITNCPTEVYSNQENIENIIIRTTTDNTKAKQKSTKLQSMGDKIQVWAIRTSLKRDGHLQWYHIR